VGGARCVHRRGAGPEHGIDERFFTEQANHELSEAERVRALELMEMQRHTQLMYTSCGWFFDDISGIETVQIIAYAARVLQLAKEIFGEQAAGLEPKFIARMARQSPTWPARRWSADLQNLRGHDGTGPGTGGGALCISSIFSSFAEETELFCYRVRRISYDIHSSGRGRLALGRANIASAIPASSRASRLRFCTSATRTLRRQ